MRRTSYLLLPALLAVSHTALAQEGSAGENAAPPQPKQLSTSQLATAPEPPSAFRAVLVGAFSALVPFAIGATSMGFATSFENRNLGFLLANTGFISAPLMSHGVQGEWGRGALFSLPSLVCEGVMIGLVSAIPDGVFKGTIVTRTIFSGFFTGSVFFSIAGVVDAALAGDRQLGHGIFGAEPGPFRVLGVAPGVSTSPYGVTVELSL